MGPEKLKFLKSINKIQLFPVLPNADKIQGNLIKYINNLNQMTT